MCVRHTQCAVYGWNDGGEREKKVCSLDFECDKRKLHKFIRNTKRVEGGHTLSTCTIFFLCCYRPHELDREHTL